MIESISEFYQRIDRKGPEDAKGKEFIDLQPSRCNVGKVSFSYRDFYKIALVTEKGKLYYADKWILLLWIPRCLISRKKEFISWKNPA